MQASGDNWEAFVQEYFLSSGKIDGILLLTKRGELVYSYGQLCSVNQNQLQQFVKVFCASTDEEEEAVCKKGFILQESSGKDVHFNVYQKTFCSAYCTSEANNQGLIVCNLPYGVLLASHPLSHTSTTAIEVVERACQILRA